MSKIFPNLTYSYNIKFNDFLKSYHIVIIENIFVLVLNEKNRNGERIFDGSKVPGGSDIFIAHGSKFEYRQIDSTKYMNSRGPLLKPLVVSVSGPEDKDVHVILEYTIVAKEDTLSSRSR